MSRSALALVAAPRRREILRLVWRQERAAGEIHRRLDAVAPLSFPAVSQHLAALADAGLIECRRDGRRRFYRACPERLGALAAALESMWGDALERLKLVAELEASRRGPRPQGDADPQALGTR